MEQFAELRYDIIAEHGRFPHRDEILGRKPAAAEIDVGDLELV